MEVRKEMEMFEAFCKEYNLEYNFKVIGSGTVYASNETHKAFIVYRYGR